MSATQIVYDTLFIGGAWRRPSTDAVIEVFSASSEEPIGRVPEAGKADVDAAVGAARRAFDDPTGWTASASARAETLERFADELVQRAKDIAFRVSCQNGMPVTLAARREATAPAAMLRYNAAMIRETPTEEVRASTTGGTTVVRREPLGVIAAVVPWNYPQTLTFFKIAPALAAGCTVVVKPSPETVLDAMLIAEAAEAADLPGGVLSILPGGTEAGAYLISHPSVDKVTFTGSTETGRSIAETCGRLLRPVTLELGGKSAAIVLDDANLDPLLDQLFAATMLNNGQTCFLGTRVLAPRKRYQQVVDTLVGLARSLRVGDALDSSTDLGPLVSSMHRDRVESYIAKGHKEGARLVTGGSRPKDLKRGWFLEPTVFADVDNGSTIAREEIFGPVLSVIPYTDDAAAVAIANDSDYGLAGTVWSADPERAMSVAAQVRTGTIGINSYKVDLASPFGGVKSSGLGRELGPEGLSANQITKSIYRDS